MLNFEVVLLISLINYGLFKLGLEFIKYLVHRVAWKSLWKFGFFKGHMNPK